MRSPKLGALLALAVLCPAPSFAVQKGIPELPAAGPTSVMPQVGVAMSRHLDALDLNAPPQLLAQTLSARVMTPTATFEERTAASMLVGALQAPGNLQVVQALLPRQGTGAFDPRLEILARRLHADSGTEAAFADLKSSLDSFFLADAMRPGGQAEPVFAAGDGESKQLAAPWRLRRVATEYKVLVGDKALDEKVSLSELMKALDEDDRNFLDRFRPNNVAAPREGVVRLEDEAGRVRVAAVAGESAGNRTIWADFLKNEKHPLLDKLKEKFTFAPFVATADDEHPVSYEEPHIDEDTAQLTLYGVKLSKNGALTTEETHVYIGERLLVTTHREENASVETGLHLLSQTGRFKTPTELMVFLLQDNISRYGAVVESLSNDFSRMSETLATKDVEHSFLEESAAAGRKIDEAYRTVLRQKQVIRALLRINEFHASPLVPAAELEKQIVALNHQLDVLDHYQDRKNGLIDLYRAKASNALDTAMKHLAAFTALIMPATVLGSLYGMNVALPWAQHPHMFWILMGVTGAAMGAIYLVLRKMRWL